MSSPMWLPPLNSHENHKLVILASQFKEAMIDMSYQEEIFFIRVAVNVSFYSESNSKSPLCLRGLLLNEEFRVPCCLLTCSPQEHVKHVLLSSMHVPFQLDNIIYTQRSWKGRCCRLCEGDADSWIQQLQNFLRSMKCASHNANCNIFPLKILIRKNVMIPDDEFQAWISWYNEKKSADPTFSQVYSAAISRRRTIQELLDADFNLKGADNSSLAILQVVRLDDDSQSPRKCTVCMEEFSSGLVAYQLPCSHVFHKVCISKWLQQSNMCPLCRFSLPSV